MLLFSIQYRRFVGFATGAEFAFEWALKNYCKPNDVLHLLHVRHAADGVCALLCPFFCSMSNCSSLNIFTVFFFGFLVVSMSSAYREKPLCESVQKRVYACMMGKKEGMLWGSV
jgi:hypothetical protein